MSNHLSPVQRAAMSAWKPQDIRTSWEWCEDHVVVDNTSPMPGPWRSSNSPWNKEPMELAADKTKSSHCIMCSAQSTKTQMILDLLLWSIDQDPGPSMYVMANKDDAQDFVRDRFAPSMQRCEPVRELLLRETKLGFTFRTMPLYFVGAGSPAKLQGKPIKRLWLDEVRNYPPGALETVLKRVRAFGSLSQVFIISTPGVIGDAVHQAFMRGDQRRYHFPCPKCGHMQQLRMAQLKAEHPETHLSVFWKDVPGAKIQGIWNFEALGRAIRYECEKCKHLISDTPAERKAICRNGHFIRMNPAAEPCDVSFHWNALLPWWVSWKGIVKEFIEARAAARHGNIEPMRTFVTETLGEPWEDRLGVVEDFGFLEARKAAYDYGEAWPEAKRRFMAADKQEAGGEHYWYVIREFGAFGKSRLVAHGSCRTTVELEETRKQYNVGIADAMIDSGYRAQEVYRFCGATGWKAFKGDQLEYYLVQHPHPQVRGQMVTMRQIWRKTQAVVYNVMTKRRIGSIPLFTFAGSSTKDLLMEYMSGLSGDWTMPERVAKDYLKQMTGERREQRTDAKGAISYVWKRVGDNHYFDCEQMILIAAIATKTINAPMREARKDQTPNTKLQS